jgi:hypothetical protein
LALGKVRFFGQNTTGHRGENKNMKKKEKEKKKKVDENVPPRIFRFRCLRNVLNLVASRNESGSLTSVTSAPKAAFDRGKKLGFKGFFIS